MKLVELNHCVMQKRNFIRIAESFAILPILTLSIPVSGNIVNSPSVSYNAPQVVSLQQNINLNNLFALEEGEKQAQIREMRAEAIDNYYKDRDMPLAGYGMKMVIEAEKNDLDWRLLPAISIRESTGGKFACKKVKFSAFGWGSCKINFKSYDESIEIIARNLGGNNPKTSHHYDEKTTAEILKAYNPPSVIPNYVKQVFKIMESIGEENLGEQILKEKV